MNNDSNNKLARPYFGDRRSDGAYTAIAVDQDQSKVPESAHVMIDMGRGMKRIFRSIGKSIDITMRPPRRLGQTHSRYTDDNYEASWYGTTSRILGRLSLYGTNQDVAGNEPNSLFQDGAIMDHTLSGSWYNMHMFQFDCSTEPDSPNDNNKVQNWVIISVNDQVSKNARGSTLVRKQFHMGGDEPYLAYDIASEVIIPMVALGVNGRGTPKVTLISCENAGDTQVPAMHPLLDYTTDEKRQALDDLAHKMLITPDEWIARNGQALGDLMTQMSYFQANDFVGAFSKGFRGSFWTRFSDASLHVMGELLHLGMSFRQGMPIINRHASAVTQPFSLTTTGGTTVTIGYGVRADVLGAAADVDPTEAEMESGELIDDETNPDVVLNPSGDGQGNTPNWSGSMDPNWAVYGVDAAQSPFFLYIPDAMYEIGAPSQEQGLFYSIPELGNLLQPGDHEIGNDSRSNRDLVFTDFLVGLKWVCENISSDEASIWGSIGSIMLEQWEDMKQAKTWDVYSEDARTDEDKLIAAYHLGMTTTTPFQTGTDVSGNATICNAKQYYDPASQFLNLPRLEEFKRDLDDLSKRNFEVGADFMLGMQKVGDANSSVYHRQTYDGIDHNIDIKIRPVAFGHWSLVPLSWVTNGTTYYLTNDLTEAGSVIRSNVHADQMALGNATTANTLIHTLLQEMGDYHSDPTLANLSLVFPRPDHGGMMNWTNLFETSMITGIKTVLAAASDRTIFGADLHGLTMYKSDNSIAVELDVNSQRSIIDAELVNMKTTSCYYSWLNKRSLLIRKIRKAKDVTPYKTEFQGIAFEDINLVALLTFNTGLPSLQQMGDAMFHLGFCGQTGGWHFENRHTLERQIWNPEVHTYPNRRQAAVPDWFAVLVPKTIEPSKILTTYASANLLSYHLGLLGERWLKDTAKSVVIDFAGVRTIFRNEIWINGDVTELAITGQNVGFDFFNEEPLAAANITVTNQLVCQPGARWYQRLFTHLDPTAAHGATNSLCSLFGQVQVASLAGSAVPGLTGYAAAVPDDTVGILHRVLALGSTEWLSTDPNVLTDRRAEPDFIRLMAERNRGDDNLHYTEAGLRIAFIDQDLFDRDTACDSALEHIQNGNMWLGPCPHLVVYDQAGQVVHEVSTVYELVGSGQSVAPAVSTPDPVQEIAAPQENTVPGPESETPEKTEGKEEAGDPQL